MNHKRLRNKINKDCGIMSGNVISSVQYSSYIRPVTQTECNGMIFEPNHLHNHDLKLFKSYRIPSRYIEHMKKDKDTMHCLYVIRDVDRGNTYQHATILTRCVPVGNRFKEYLVARDDTKPHYGVSLYACQELGLL